MALAGHADEHSLQAMHLHIIQTLPLLPSWVSPQSMLSSELGRKRTLFIWIVDCPLRLERVQYSDKEERIEILWTNQLRFSTNYIIVCGIKQISKSQMLFHIVLFRIDSQQFVTLGFVFVVGVVVIFVIELLYRVFLGFILRQLYIISVDVC